MALAARRALVVPRDRRTSVPPALGALGLIVLGGLWLVADKAFEGPHLVRLAHKHGIVAADLVAIAAVAVAGIALVRVVRVVRARRGTAILEL